MLYGIRHPVALPGGAVMALAFRFHLEKLRDILAVLDRSRSPDDMDLPGFRLHPLKGALKGQFAVSVSGNWRVTFRFENGHAVDVDYLDYH